MSTEHVWVAAVAAVDMGLMLGETCAALAQTLQHCSTPRELLDVWRNTYPSVPPIYHELAHTRALTDLALLFARVHHAHETIHARPGQRDQIRTTALSHARQPTQFARWKQRGYVGTHAKLMQQEALTAVQAGAHAYLLHAHDTLQIVPEPPGTAHHLTLPSNYLGVDTEGKLFVLDATRGASPLQASHRVPHAWCARVSPHNNEFLAGDSNVALSITVDDELAHVYDTPVVLPRYPTSHVTNVEHRWITWTDTNGHPRALQWDSDTATLCSNDDARLYASTVLVLRPEGNTVWRDAVCLATLPPSESITCVHGTPSAFDAFTQGGDWWRVDVRARRAWVVSVPAANVIRAIAPMVQWIH